MSGRLQAVVLAAGEGSRLRPLTDHVPKPLLPIDGRAVIDQVLGYLDHLRCDPVYTVVGHRSDVLREYLAGVDPPISFVEQAERLGSAHALKCALASGMPRRDSLVVASDTVFRLGDIETAIARFQRDRPIAMMTLRRWPIEQLPHRSAVITDGDGKIARVVEKPAADTLDGSLLAGAPLFVLSEQFWPYVEALEPSPNGMYELAAALQAAIDDGHTVLGSEIFETRDITRPTDILRENFRYLREYLPAGPV